MSIISVIWKMSAISRPFLKHTSSLLEIENMRNFEFDSKTRIVFGKDTEGRAGEYIAPYGKKILLHYGSDRIKNSGLYDRIAASLRKSNIDFLELGAVQPNPRLSLVHQGIEICRDNGLDAVLAVGGGSAIDSAKAIAFGVPYAGNVWDFFEEKAEVRETLPVGVVLTIPAAGSESSKSCVITKEDGWLKRPVNTLLIKPEFAILNPELTFTLPPYQTACGAADMMAHVMERYFTREPGVELTDRLCEATLKTIIHNVSKALANPSDYAARAEIMWSGAIAHNGILDTGRGGDWASHIIEHEVSGIYDIAHGAGLAILYPAWMKFVYRDYLEKFVQYAVRVWNVDEDFDNPERTAEEGIKRLEGFFKSIGLPTRLKDCDIGDDRLEEMADKYGLVKPRGDIRPIYRDEALEILRLALE